MSNRTAIYAKALDLERERDALREVLAALITRDDFWSRAGVLPAEYDDARELLGLSVGMVRSAELERGREA